MRWRRSIFTGMSLKKWMKLPDHEVRFTFRREHAGRECADGCVPGLKQLRESLEEEQILQLKDLDVCMIPVGGYYTIDWKKEVKRIEDHNI